MSPITHALLPLALGYAWLPKREHMPALGASALIALCGALPDILDPHLSLEARHRSWSHTLAALAVFGLLVTAATRLPRLGLTRRVAALCVVAYGLHIACDLISGGGRPLRPFTAMLWGDDYVPSWTWGASDLGLLLFVYFAYRWYPLRRHYLERIKAR